MRILVLLAVPSIVMAAPCAPRAGAQAMDSSPKVIFDTDDRIDLYQEGDPRRRAWARATCAMVLKEDLTEDEQTGAFQLATATFRGRGLFGLIPVPPCPGEPFAEQPASALCTGFMVGADLIATAGHCIDPLPLDRIRFVFGFEMVDASTAVTEFAPYQIYEIAEIVAQRLEGNYDYAILRTRRPITVPGVRALELRRAGSIAVGTPVGIIGHPGGLPLKMAFGPGTTVRNAANPAGFTANLDAFSGNSGSAVINPVAGWVEGIYVVGQQKVEAGLCFTSLVLPSGDSRFVGSTKSSAFAEFVPSGRRGQVALNKMAYRCSDTLEVEVVDRDLAQTASASITILTSGGDVEEVQIAPAADDGELFFGSIPVETGRSIAGNGVVEIAEGHSITALYSDADDGTGAAAVLSASALVDCTAPILTDVAVDYAVGTGIRFRFQTDEPAVGAVNGGRTCGAGHFSGTGSLALDHVVGVGGLSPLTEYAFTVSATDAAGNNGFFSSGGSCFDATTTESVDFFTQALGEDAPGLEGRSITFTPDDSPSGYSACLREASSFFAGTLGGDLEVFDSLPFQDFTLTRGMTFPFYGKSYRTIWIGANGYLTFGVYDGSSEPEFENHFALPRIAGLFTELDPETGGQITKKQLGDRAAVTFDNVPDTKGDTHSFQMELFFDGTIRITWLKLTRPKGIVGLSSAHNAAFAFVSSDFNSYASCAADLGSRGFACNGAPAGAQADDFWLMGALGMVLWMRAQGRTRKGRSVRHSRARCGQGI